MNTKRCLLDCLDYGRRSAIFFVLLVMSLTTSIIAGNMSSQKRLARELKNLHSADSVIVFMLDRKCGGQFGTRKLARNGIIYDSIVCDSTNRIPSGKKFSKQLVARSKNQKNNLAKTLVKSLNKVSEDRMAGFGSTSLSPAGVIYGFRGGDTLSIFVWDDNCRIDIEHEASSPTDCDVMTRIFQNQTKE